MPDGTPFKDPGGLWLHGGWETEVRTGPKRNRAELVEQVNAIRALVGDAPSVIYAVRMPDGIIKIGCTTNLVRRRYGYYDAEILAFRPGDLAEEKAIHASLAEHLVRGREWYKPVPAVLDVVNDLRGHFNLEPLPYEDAA